MDNQTTAYDFIQASRVLRVKSPLGDDVLLPERLDASEGVSQLFEFNVALRSKRDIQPDELVGKLVDVEIEVGQNQSSDDPSDIVYRPLNGLVVGLNEGPPVTRGLRSYSLTMRPQMWLLSQRSDCRIWQNLTSLDILDTLLSEHGLPAADATGIVARPPAQEYSVQWNETDLAYLTRRLEEDGIFYWFSHELGQHTLHVSNSATGWLAPSAASQGEIRARIAQGSADINRIYEWTRQYNYVPGVRAGADFNFETNRIIPSATTPGLIKLPGNSNSELYEYPARALTMEAAERQKKLRMQATEADHNRVSGKSNVRVLEAGRRFMPYEEAHPDQPYEEHVIVTNSMTVVDLSYETNVNQPEFENRFEAIPSRMPLTPHRTTPRPKIDGTQIAIIAGPPGEEIHIDKYGRVKLWFPWDRYAKRDGSDTKWFEVLQTQSGGTWGQTVHPRVGMQAIVAYQNGDPDRPYILGLNTNPDHMPSYELPANKTRTIYRSNTYKGTGFNEYSTEDYPGKENQFFHAQRDQTTRVLRNRTERVDADEVMSVGGNQMQHVAVNQKTEIGGSMNLVVGATGTRAVALTASFNGLASEAGAMLQQAMVETGEAGIPETEDPSVSSFAAAFAQTDFSNLSQEGLTALEQGLENATSPRPDQGIAQLEAGEALGEDVGGSAPCPGILSAVIAKIQLVAVGIASLELVGLAKIIAIGGAKIEKIGLGVIETIGAAMLQTIGGAKIVNIGLGSTEIVGGAKLTQTGLGLIQNIAAAKLENIGLGDIQNVGGAKNVNVGAGYIENVGAAKLRTVGAGSMEFVGGIKMTQVGGAYMLIVGKSKLLMLADGTIMLAGKAIVIAGDDAVAIKGGAIALN